MPAKESSQRACSHCQKPPPEHERCRSGSFNSCRWVIPMYFPYAPRRGAPVLRPESWSSICPERSACGCCLAPRLARKPVCASSLLWLDSERSAQIRVICSDVWQPYLNLIAARAEGTLNILDRDHK